MRLLCVIAISVLTVASTSAYGQGWKDKIGLTTQKKGKVYAKDLSEEDVDQLVYHKRKTDEGIVSEYQKANLNKIVFSSKKLAPSEVNGDNVKTKFSINDPVYFNIMLPQALTNYIIYPQDENGNFLDDYCYDYSFKKWYPGDGRGAYNTDTGLPVRNIHGSTQIEFYLDGELYNCPISLRGVNTSSTQTIYSDWIFDDPSKHDPQPDWVDLVQNLSEGEHEVKLIVYAKTNGGQDVKSTKEPIAEGSFTLVRNPGESFTPKFDMKWADYKRGMNDGDLNSKILKEIQRFGAASKYKEEFQAIKVSSDRWTITRNALTGIPIDRSIVVYCKAKWPDGFCKVQRFLFKQDYNGSGFGEIYCAGVYWNSAPKAIDCD
ncbi:hypothetical protein K6119_13810 [Paracrocinitomix mangrovi]|uniref:hypothetical protein n=1 Tax=Paracrocinitomix mangrovi TaxID=2862509 RepID=UPI001C8EC3E2|nr:hypothetical protein [Paracrocinitomix mangrovi]UKN00805.1 hypothetical protein K6119_13810 [Paracrocinitomix mangrovi]